MLATDGRRRQAAAERRRVCASARHAVNAFALQTGCARITVSRGDHLTSALESSPTMRDRDVRAALRRTLAERHANDDSLIVEELGLCQGQVRVDIAVVNGELSGFEIKSPSDTLVRFRHQADMYSRVLDCAWLVASPQTLELAEPPRWWGLMAMVESAGRPELLELRPACVNPCPDPFATVQLLWHDETLAILRALGSDRGVRSKPRSMAWRRLVEVLEPQRLREVVRTTLKERQRPPVSPRL